MGMMLRFGSLGSEAGLSGPAHRSCVLRWDRYLSLTHRL
jgi:hypothetical protein